jgi:RNA polymerase primary sigma factor
MASGNGVFVANDDKFGRLRQLVDSGKEKGYVLYDEVNELLPDELTAGPELEDLLADFDTAGVEILEEPKLEFEKKLDDSEDFSDIDLPQDFVDKTNDPVRMYLREMGTVPLLTREGEIELAKRIERGQRSVGKALSRSPLVVREILQLGNDIRNGVVLARDLVMSADPLASEETADSESNDLVSAIDEIGNSYYKTQQLRQKLQSISKQMKPKQHRTTRYELLRTIVTLSLQLRKLPFSTPTQRGLTSKLRAAVEEFKMLEREIARAHRKYEESETAVTTNGRDLKKDLRQCGSRRIACSSSKRNAVRVRQSCGALFISLIAAKRRRTPQRSSSLRRTCALSSPSRNDIPIAACSSSI